MSKIYLIGGVARSGKSIISNKMLIENKISGTDTDSLRAMLEHGNPLLNISYKNKPEKNTQLMKPYLEAFIENKLKSSETSFVLEGDLLIPSFLKNYKNRKEVKVCFIGYSKITAEQKKLNINKYANSKDWTKDRSDKEITSFINWGIKESKKYKEQCSKFDIKYFDTSINFENSIKNILDYLVN